MTSKKTKSKKRKKIQKQNIEKKNLKRIEEVKEEDAKKRTKRKVDKAKARKETGKKSKDSKETKIRKTKEVSKKVPKAVNKKETKKGNKKLKVDEIEKDDSLKKSKTTKKSATKKKVKRKIDKAKADKICKGFKIATISVTIPLLIVIAVLAYLALRPKFQDITIELGSIEEMQASDFLVSQMYKNGAYQVTNLGNLDLTAVQETEITLEFKGKMETVMLNIVDTTAPTVEFKDHMAYLDYIPDANDFIESKEDFSEMTVEFVTEPEFEDYGTYNVTIKVTDGSGNVTTGNCELMITWLLTDVYIELGGTFSVSDIVVDTERFGSLVPEEELAKVNTSELGTYEINVEIDGKPYTSTVIVQDTTPPDLVLQNITIWDDETVPAWESFIVSANDISGEVTTECLSEIGTTVGTYDITIRATDVNGNINEQVATLTIRKDTTGPVIYGLSNLTISKNASVNWESGVYATDEKDGSCAVSVDSSGVNIAVAGTYYATYTSQDTSGNTTTSKRKVTVNWDYSDVTAKVSSFYNSYCAGKSAYDITVTVRDRIKYSSTSYGSSSSNIYYGLTNGSGNCIVHAYILQAMLQKAGYSCSIIHTSDGAHYWNKVGSTHYDSTPGGRHLISASSDEEKLSEAWFLAYPKYTAESFVIN